MPVLVDGRRLVVPVRVVLHKLFDAVQVTIVCIRARVTDSNNLVRAGNADVPKRRLGIRPFVVASLYNGNGLFVL